MVIIYSTHKIEGLEGIFSNPELYDVPDMKATKVITDDEKIRDDYEKLEIDVEFVEFEEAKADGDDEAVKLELLKTEAVELGVEFSPNIGYATLLKRVEEAKAK
ncbi:hypothetical protein PF327_10810 [Sulfurovum sp. XTW-4]|uniref:Uncharacterized protein n=1 Tax=Sulfurovum xiamenensis TaxID=3019066 RepID=A0ABT7QUC9_9BACT|nr:hypothetical protein [Sulfurovum xiamenensis]MDM5264685.1 hypothetical protein [Sulfurovum xiamenensis]